MNTSDISALSPADTVLQMFGQICSFRAVYVAAELGLADLLAAKPQNVAELAATTGCDAPSLYRVMRALTQIGFFTEDEEGGRFTSTPLGAILQSDVPGSMRGLVRMMGADWHWRSWEGIVASVRSGKPAIDIVLGSSFYEFLSAHPSEAQIFDQAMTSLSSVENAAISRAIELDGAEIVVDVGGGHGNLLIALLESHPGARGILFDRPPAIDGARAAIRESRIGDRCELIGGDFFVSIPSGGDVYLLKFILHNWNDERAAAILRRCREAMTPGGRLLLLEQVVPRGNEPSPTKVLDLQMMVFLEGRERTVEEFRALLSQTGFALERVVSTGTIVHIIEAVAR
ncbi:methyltransferase [Pendulispora albinea]|uniref:Acetylserotonin O-methyltransferase n=1 Tax=Pendulispora albinea TaxID=2741071 RepID=A0ABZ2LMT6_9BACT